MVLRNRGGRGVQAAIAAFAVAGLMSTVGDAGAQQSAVFRVGVNDAALRFTPETIKVSKGGTVVWSFAGSTTVHNIVTENDVPADSAWKDFSTPPAGADGEFQYTFKETGVYEYLCDLHRVQGMVGKVTVVEGPVATPTATPDRTPSPLITPTPTPNVPRPNVPATTPTVSRDTPAPTAKWAADKTAPAFTKVSGARSGATGAKVKWTLSE